MENMQDEINRLKEQSLRLKKEVKSKIATYLGAAFGFVAGLAWNDAIKALIDYFFPISKNTLLAKFIYAILVTLIVVLISVYLVKLLKTEND